MADLIFTDEAKTYLAFPSDHAFAQFRDYVKSKYASSMVAVARDKVYKDGHTVAVVDHASNLGAELRGIAYGYGGSSEHTYLNQKGTPNNA